MSFLLNLYSSGHTGRQNSFLSTGFETVHDTSLGRHQTILPLDFCPMSIYTFTQWNSFVWALYIQKCFKMVVVIFSFSPISLHALLKSYHFVIRPLTQLLNCYLRTLSATMAFLDAYIVIKAQTSKSHVQNAIHVFNSTRHDTTGFIPHVLMSRRYPL